MGFIITSSKRKNRIYLMEVQHDYIHFFMLTCSIYDKSRYFRNQGIMGNNQVHLLCYSIPCSPCNYGGFRTRCGSAAYTHCCGNHILSDKRRGLNLKTKF